MRILNRCGSISAFVLLIVGSTPALAQTVSIYDHSPRPPGSIPHTVYQRVIQNDPEPEDVPQIERGDSRLLDRSIGENTSDAVPAQFHRQVVAYATHEPVGTIVIDTQSTYLYYVLGGGKAIRYGIGVGRDGFTWSGVRAIERKTEWPDWIPPKEMIDRQPDLPRWMAGGPGNPLGARAMYLAGTLFRIHGTSQPSSIGQRVSSGCIRMLNEDVIDLFDRAHVGTKVAVLGDSHRLLVAIERERRSPQTLGEHTRSIYFNSAVGESELTPLRLD